MMMGSGLTKAVSNAAKISPRDEAVHMQKVIEDQSDLIKRLETELNVKNSEILQLKSNLGFPRESIVSDVSRTGKAKTSFRKRRDEVSAEVMTLTGTELAKSPSYQVIPKNPEVHKLISKVVEVNILFKDIPDDIKNKMIDAFQEVIVDKDRKVIVQDELYGQEFYVVESGTLEVIFEKGGNSQLVCGQLNAGQGFGELALLHNTPRAATIRSRTDCKLWMLTRQIYNEIKFTYTHQKRKRFIELLSKVKFFENLNKSEVIKLSDALTEEKFEKGAVIIREGEVGEHFYIVAEGTVQYETLEDGIVGSAATGDFFGHKALFTDELRRATVRTLTDAACLVLGRNDFVSLLGALQEVIDRDTSQHDTRSLASQEEQEENRCVRELDVRKTEKIPFQNLQLKFNEKEVILGQGAFGKVLLVTDSHKSYALKCLSKKQIVRGSLIHHVVIEREVLTLLNHQFIARFYESYWDNKYIYFLMEVCLGGELFTLLQRKKKFTEKATKFFSAIVLDTFDYLHSKNIIYRDLKPENLMLDSTGYLKVVDFGLAKVTRGKTWTLCGTPDYIAPEIITMSGHGKSVDYWALGVLIYELAVGRAPYAANDQLETYEKILKRDIKFPSSLSNGAMTLITKLNKKDPVKRLGSGKAGAKEVMKNIWFAGFDWEKLISREMEPAVPVEVKDNTDISNFPFAKATIALDAEAEFSWQPDFPQRI